MGLCLFVEINDSFHFISYHRFRVLSNVSSQRERFFHLWWGSAMNILIALMHVFSLAGRAGSEKSICFETRVEEIITNVLYSSQEEANLYINSVLTRF